MAKLARVLIMAGGTGGHVFPGLAVAKELHAQGVIVHWLGTRKGLEAQWVPKLGIPLHFITIRGFRGKRLKNKFFSSFLIGIALVQSMKIIWQFRPNVVIGMGGFVSGPGGIASWLLGKKLVIHEQNAKPGSTNTWLAKIAYKVLEAFPNTFIKNRHKVHTVGNPVRDEIVNTPPPDKRFSPQKKAKKLLILGGSLGAQAINELLPKALARLPATKRFSVWHQSGEKHLANTLKAYENAGLEAQVVPFINEMDKAYAWADVVLCRAGALTISELCTVGLGAILVPFPNAIDDHQTANANFMAEKSAAWLVQQAVLSVDKLASLLEDLWDSEQYKAMAQAAYTLRKVDATEKIVTLCKEICC
ncbi:MAG: murG [Gammaproteobacteria bacterium]|jgi:UDP-N-acetylglucosamine--N-acetylmuramyl-(pentapeptide) pyrophosphoryl-undecaprenol N-acetylglucosamine transferase|nr:murG [Gammaproteobacteria bacterium]